MRVVLSADHGQYVFRLLVAFTDDAEYLGVDDLSGLLAERPLTHVPHWAAQVRILAWRKLHEPEPLAHAPARDHPASEGRGLLDVVLGARRPRPADDLLGRAASQHPDDPRAE